MYIWLVLNVQVLVGSSQLCFNFLDNICNNIPWLQQRTAVVLCSKHRKRQQRQDLQAAAQQQQAQRQAQRQEGKERSLSI